MRISTCESHSRSEEGAPERGFESSSSIEDGMERDGGREGGRDRERDSELQYFTMCSMCNK